MKTQRITHTITRAAMTLLVMLTMTLTASATDFITDVIVIGNSNQTEFNDLQSYYVSQGWTAINKDLNAGCGSSSDYIHLLYKKQNSSGNSVTPITDFYIRTGSNPPSSLTHQERTYYLVPCDGSSEFVASHGDLNHGAGGTYIYLYYTKDVMPNQQGVTGITFNTTQSGAVGANGGTTGYDLNHGAGGSYIYMHLTTDTGANVVTLTSGVGNVDLHNGHKLTGTGGSDTHVTIADGATVTLSGVNITAITNDDSHSWAGISCLGDAVIILDGGTTNNVKGGHLCSGIHVVDDKTLTIQGSGTLNATGDEYAAGIGSGQSGTCGNIIISGGTITATGGKYAAGIGSGLAGTCGNIIISGGTITATGGKYAAGIGSGYLAHCGNITITDGVTMVTATKGENAYNAIGTGYNGGTCGTVTIGGVQTGFITQSPFVTFPYTVSFDANGGTGSMANMGFMYNVAKSLAPNSFTRPDYMFVGWAASANGEVVYYDEQSVSNLTETSGATVTLYAKWMLQVYRLTSGSGDVELPNGSILTGTGGPDTHVTIADGATVTLSGVNITAISNNVSHSWSGISCLGDAVIILDGGTTNNVTGGFRSSGIHVVEGKTLTILGSGTLNATGDQYAAGIGSGRAGTCGNITIEGGTITATGGRYAAGIGSGFSNAASCGNITITDGVTMVTAIKGENGQNAIGTGYNGSCGAVTIGGVQTGSIAQSPFVTFPYTVSFNANGGTGSMANMGFMYGVAQNLIPNSFTRPNYVFVGWAISANGPKVYEDEQSVSNLTETTGATVTLYAKWSTGTILTPESGDVELQNGDVLTGTGGPNTHVTIADGATVTFRGVNITTIPDNTNHHWSGISCLGDVVIVLYEGMTNNVKGGLNCPGIHVVEGKTLTIRGSGTLNATGDEYAAGIGSGQYGTCGNIIISGGTITATGGKYAAGIGSGYFAHCGNITITDGVTMVTATKGENADNAIGTGHYGSCGTVTIGGVQTGFIAQSPFVTFPYTVSFDANGGTGSMANMGFMYNVAKNLTPNSFTRAYCDFIGWATSADGEVVYYDEQSVSNLTETLGTTATLYAKWKAFAPTGLTCTEVTPIAATLSWTETGQATAWQIMLNDDESNLVCADEIPFTVTSLVPQTTYTAKVRVNCCGTYSDWSSSVSFTTLYACLTPTGLTCTEETPTTATLDWTQIGQTTAWQIMLNDDESNLINANEKPFTLTGLTPETTYSAKVRAVCEEGDWSDWSDPVSFMPNYMFIIGSHNYNSIYLPLANYHKYSLTEQIYTAEELGEAGSIRRISFYKNSDVECYGDIDIYMVHTDKDVFYNTSDWISVSEANHVFSGTVNFIDYAWTNITFDNDFDYDGIHNVVIVIYANTSSENVITYFKAFDTGSQHQALVYSNPTHTFDPPGIPDHASAHLNTKNQIRVLKVSCSTPPTDLAVTNVRGSTATLSWTETGQATAWQIMLNDDESNFFIAEENPFTLSGLTPETTYTAKVRAYINDFCQCEWSDSLSFTTTQDVYYIGSSDGTDTFVPLDNLYKYSLTQQIYTVAELGEAGLIESIGFYKKGTINCNRNLDIYMVHTDMDEFEDTSDWIAVSANNKVFSGTVNFTNNAWTTITLDNCFFYDGMHNVAIIVDDNTGAYKSQTFFKTFDTEQSQAIYQYSNDTNCTPTSPPDNANNIMTKKSQLRVQKVTSFTPRNLAVTNVSAVTAVLRWIETGHATSWQIMLNDDESNLVYADRIPFRLTGLTSETTYTAKVRANYNGIFSNWSNSVRFNTIATDVQYIGSGDDGCPYIPLNNHYCYSLTQQIYTVEELGEAGIIESIGFYKYGSERCNRNIDIYMVHTNKDMFYQIYDWISVSEADHVFSGNVNFINNAWTIITLDEYFDYDGMHNVAIIVYDNTDLNLYDVSFKTFHTGEIQTRYKNSYYPIDLYSESGYEFSHEKNQLRIVKAVISDCMKPMYLTVTEVGSDYAVLDWDEYGTAESWSVTCNGETFVTNWHPFTLTGLTPETEYEVYVTPTCNENAVSDTVTFTTLEITTFEQTIALSAGVNWFSPNVEITLDDLKAALLEALPNTSVTIKGKSGSIKYIVRTHTWNGTLDWDVTKMYKIEVPSACELTLGGVPVNPAEHPVTIVNGPNWIGYPLPGSMTVAEAFADFGVVTGDVVKSKSGSTRYRNGSWRPNGLTTLEPGQGYIYNSAATGERTLVFPSGAK